MRLRHSGWPTVAAHRLARPQRVAAPNDREPDQRRQRPDRQRRLPAAERVVERDRGERRDRRAGHERGARTARSAGPRPGTSSPAPTRASTTCVSAIAAPASSVPRYSGAIPPSPRAAVPSAVHSSASGDDPLDGEAARDPRTERREDAQAQQRPRRQQPRRRGRQSELSPDVGQQRRQAPEERPQVQPGQEDRATSSSNRRRLQRFRRAPSRRAWARRAPRRAARARCWCRAARSSCRSCPR